MSGARATWVAVALLALGGGFATAQDKPPLGPGPSWRGPVRPTGRNEVFATGDGCAMCHSVASTAMAMRSSTGAVPPCAACSAAANL